MQATFSSPLPKRIFNILVIRVVNLSLKDVLSCITSSFEVISIVSMSYSEMPYDLSQSR